MTADETEKIIKISKDLEDAKLKIKAFEDAAKTHEAELKKKDDEIAKLNKILVKEVLTREDPASDDADESAADKTPMDLYAETIKGLKKD